MRAFEYTDAARHYHRVDDDVYHDVCRFLQSILIKRVEGGSVLTISLSRALADTIFEFLQEMELSYIHPRRHSAKVLFSKICIATPGHE